MRDPEIGEHRGGGAEAGERGQEGVHDVRPVMVGRARLASAARE
jgi:hypothetical protein